MSGACHSFDVFDTTLTRAVARPTDLFRGLAGAWSAPPETCLRLRVAAERAARRRARGREVTLEEIYRRLAPAMGWTPEQARLAMTAELDLERHHLRPVPEIRARIAQLRNAGERVAWVSDVYLPADWLRERLAEHGCWMPGDALYVSSAEGVTKRSGRLYRVALAREGIVAPAWRHVGDNQAADGRAARRVGIRAELFTAARLNRHEQALADLPGTDADFRSRLAAAARLARLARPDDVASPDERTLWDVGASVIGPLGSGYVAWCLREAERRGIRRLYFVSRDGQILHRLAGALGRAWGAGVDCRYLFGSRQAWHLPALAFADAPASQEGIGDETLFQSLEAVLRRVGLEGAAARAAQAESELADLPSHRNLDAAARRRVREALRRDPLRARVRAVAAARWDATAQYLREAGLLDAEPWALVDLGWSGRMQRSLRVLLGALGADRPVTGFYFALAGRPPAAAGDQLISFLDPREFAVDGLRYIPLLEALTAADHASVAGYRREPGGHAEPVWQRRALEERQFRGVRVQQAGAVAFAEEFVRLVPGPETLTEAGPRIAARLLRSLGGAPDRREALAYRLFRAGEDQAGGRMYRLSTRLSARWFWAALLRGGRWLYRLRWPEACLAGSFRRPRPRIALLHARQALGAWKKRRTRPGAPS